MLNRLSLDTFLGHIRPPRVWGEKPKRQAGEMIAFGPKRAEM
jgi:hypothetical protein